VFEAAIRHGVKKIVITSSIAAIFPGHKPPKNHFNEEDWSVLEESPAYEKSKHLAEKEAWRIYEQNKDKIMMTIINPGMVLGPPWLNSDFTSSYVIKRIIMNDIPGIPKVSFPIVDVRDVALAHVNALERLEETNGKRYIMVASTHWMMDACNILRQEFEPQGYKIPSMSVPKCPLVLASWFDS